MNAEIVSISMDELRRGLRLCGGNVTRFVRDVDILLKDSSDWHAIAFAIFAFEELGRYKMLKDLQESTVEGSTVMVNQSCLRNHVYKQQVARGLMSPEETKLFDGSFWKALGGNFRDADTFASHQVRMDCMYVDLKNGKWDSGVPVNPELIRKFCASIISALNNLGGPF